MSHRKKSHQSSYTQQTQKSMSHKSKRKRYTKRDHGAGSLPRAMEVNQGNVYHGHHPFINPNYQRLQLQNINNNNNNNHCHSHSMYHHQQHSSDYHHNHSSRRGSRYSNNNNNTNTNSIDYLPDIPDSFGRNDVYYGHDTDRIYRSNERNNNIQHILKAVRREYQQQVDHVISKWKELLDRAQVDVEKYRNIYHSERTHSKKLQQTIDQLKSKLKKYKNKDNENQIIILNLQQRLNELYDDLTEITTPSHTPRYYYMNTPSISLNNINNINQNMYKPKFPLASPKKIRQQNDSYYNYNNNNKKQNIENVSKTHNNKTPLKSSLPPPSITNNNNNNNNTLSILSPGSMGNNNKNRRNSRSGNNLSVLPPPSIHSHSTQSPNHSELVCSINEHETNDNNNNNNENEEDIDVEDDDIILVKQNVDITDKIVKTRDDLKKILDAIDDGHHHHHHNNNHNKMNDIDINDSLNDNNNDDLNDTEHINNKCISIIIKYKDKLFKNNSNTIKVSSGISLNEFVSQLCDAININPSYIQLQHNTNIIDINNTLNMKSTLSQLDIDNFDNIFVYIDYNKLLLTNNNDTNSRNDDDTKNEGDNDNDIDNDTIKLMKKCKSLFVETANNKNQQYSKNMLLLESSIYSLCSYCIDMENEQCLYSIITDCILENNANLMCKLLCNKISNIMKCQYVRLYFKWNNITQIIYPQNINIKEQIIIDLNDDNHDNKSLLMDIINEFKEKEENNINIVNSMKCYNNPSQSNSNFNTIFNKQFNYNIDSTLIAPLLFKNELIGIIQLINKQNKTNYFEFTLKDKQKLVPFTKVFAIALKLLYHTSSSDKMFSAINTNNDDNNNDDNVAIHSIDHIINHHNHSQYNQQQHLFSNTRVNRGISRAIKPQEINRKPQSHSITTDDHHNIINGRDEDVTHDSISRDASPAYYDNVSTTSSVKSHSTPLFAPMIHPSSTTSPPAPYHLYSHSQKNNNTATAMTKKQQQIKRKRNESEQYNVIQNEIEHHSGDIDHHQQDSIVINVSEFKRKRKKKQQQQQEEEEEENNNDKSRRSISHSSDSSSNNNNNNDSNEDELITPPTPTETDNVQQNI